MSNLIVSLSPHIHGNDSIKRNMYGVVIALLPALLVSFYYFGVGAAVVCITSVVSCVFFEWAINRYLLRNRNLSVLDGSAVITGLLLGFNLPSNIPVWIVVIGSLVAIGIGKMTFGGLGCNPFNPALVGRCFLLVSFPAQMTSWPVTGQQWHYMDAVTEATPLSIMKEAAKTGDATVLEKLPDSLSMILGNNGATFGGGSIGEVCALALLAGLAYMLWRNIITWHIPISILLTIFAFSGILHIVDSSYADPMTVLFSGGVMLGAIFMATDYVTSPMTHKGQIIYGVSIAVLTIVIRNWGAYPEGMSFAILVMNAFTPLINMYVRPKRFGENRK
ncbi:RnfABCDGE type electron transport complex subunit D [Leyella lascolaii]|uniref:Ion-translocating oxidoreductase complex subunit D n=1 Tax=Leyella lascolaii TaxID=1776379 RepID=A0AAW7JPQ0_9BACT|nr:RnfABCDGE type electron transport complex subunit D [Leyella lascolaii]MDN0023673.1 RnfABCDGE type electron transport complex subunit D [Leyella lascolaii]MDN0026016.1 RnfABCDGE type electron transport complex subunit D [Leyella lascolaii]